MAKKLNITEKKRQVRVIGVILVQKLECCLKPNNILFNLRTKAALGFQRFFYVFTLIYVTHRQFFGFLMSVTENSTPCVMFEMQCFQYHEIFSSFVLKMQKKLKKKNHRTSAHTHELFFFVRH